MFADKKGFEPSIVSFDVLLDRLDELRQCAIRLHSLYRTKTYLASCEQVSWFNKNLPDDISDRAQKEIEVVEQRFASLFEGIFSKALTKELLSQEVSRNAKALLQ